MINENVRILAIEDNNADLRLLCEHLKGRPSFRYELESADTLKVGIDLLTQKTFSVLLLDLNLPDSKGLEGLERIVQIHGIPPIVILTGLDDEDTGRHAIMKGAQDYIVKDRLDTEVLIRTINYSIERHRLKEQLDRTNNELRNKAAELMSANEGLNDSRRSALSLLEEAILARNQVEKANKLLRVNEERVRTALQNTPISITAQDKDLRILWVYNYLASDASPLIGKSDQDIFPPDEAAHLIALKNQVLTTGISAREKLFLSFDGKCFLVDIYLEPFIETDGRISGIGSVIIDLSKKTDPE